MTASAKELMDLVEARAFMIYAMKCERGETDSHENNRLIGWCMAAAHSFTLIAYGFRLDESYLQSLEQIVLGENDEDDVAGN